MNCSVCSHPQEAEIAREFLAGEHLRSLGQKYSVSKSALSRHFRDHTSNKALQKAASVQRPKRRRGEPVDVGGTLQRIASMLQDVLDDDPGSAQAIAQITGALVRVLEFLEKREAQGGKSSKDADFARLADAIEAWPSERVQLALGQCPYENGWQGCDERLVCPVHGKVTDEQVSAYVCRRAVADYGGQGA